MTSLNDYLAKKYGAKSTTTQVESSKKKKKKIKSTPTADKLGSVAIIDEEDITGQWKSVRSEDEEDEDAPIVGNSLILSFIMLKKLQLIGYSILESTETPQFSKWKPIVEDIGDEAPQIGQELDTLFVIIEHFLILQTIFIYIIVNASNDFLEYMLSEVSEEPMPKRHKSSSSGLGVGLHSSDRVRKDLERAKKDEKDLVNNMDPSLSGRGADTIYRDNVGTYALKIFSQTL